MSEWIGAVKPLMGPTALSRQLRKNGCDLGAEEVNASRGILGLPIKIIA